MHVHRKLVAASLTLLLAGYATASLAAHPVAALDVGAANAAQPVEVTLVLQVHDQPALEQYVYQTVTPGNPHYQQFLSTAQFADRYGASEREIVQLRAFLQRHGIRTGELLANHLALRASGTLGQFSAVFQTPIHDYVADDGTRFHRPSRQPTIPAALAGTLVVAAGLNNEAHYRPHNTSVQRAVPLQPVTRTLTNRTLAQSTASGIPGEYTVGDVANFYNINPLYRAGVNGAGSTVGIVTLAGFLPRDACAYWRLIGLTTKPNRITQVHVDGGGEISAEAGSGETSLDVEQSGGLAPRANIRVYDAPNSDSGFIDAFYTAVSDNIADSISVSWGLPEIFYFDSPLTGGDYTGELQAFHQVFLEAAAQGISMFAASGDSGAYDTVRALGHDLFNAPLTVDAPSSDPFITAAGGTTVPFSFSFANGPVASITRESVWSWKYLQDYLDVVLPGAYDLFSVGSGGGVSVYWHKPLYQGFTHGIKRSEPHQALIDLDPSLTLPGYTRTTPLTLLTLPGHFAGRNLPDISLNADPETGYLVISSTDSPDGVVTGLGGTSFVAPQLNGISALLRQSTGRRIGLWNPQVYVLQNIFGYGSWAPFHDIRAGDNWFYRGKPGYEPGSGIGTLNVSNLNVFLRHGF